MIEPLHVFAEGYDVSYVVVHRPTKYRVVCSLVTRADEGIVTGTVAGKVAVKVQKFKAVYIQTMMPCTMASSFASIRASSS